jgi:hypothetical protein
MGVEMIVTNEYRIGKVNFDEKIFWCDPTWNFIFATKSKQEASVLSKKHEF